MTRALDFAAYLVASLAVALVALFTVWFVVLIGGAIVSGLRS